MTNIFEYVYALPLSQITAYLDHEDWSLGNENDRWLVFQRNDFADIAWPKDTRAPDYHVYVDHALKTLSTAIDCAPEHVAKALLQFDLDVLVLELDSNSLATAARQVPEIKTLIAHAANSEKAVRPHYNYYTREARQMVDHFRLIQSTNGKTHYNIESEVGNPVPYQRKLFDKADPGVILPLERRVMERIVAGLVTTTMAAKREDEQLLVEGYTSGFNANMCDAVKKMSEKEYAPIQYNVKWARSIGASATVQTVKSIEIARKHASVLQRASEELRKVEPVFDTIKGLVIGLSSLVDPQSDEIGDRSIVILWERTRSKVHTVRIELTKSDYLLAYKAHFDWSTIAVDGIIHKRSSGWHLSDPQEFRILR